MILASVKRFENLLMTNGPTTTQSSHDPYAALRSPGFRLFLTGNVLSVIGMQMQTVAVGWEIYKRTESNLALGLVGLVQFVPVIALALSAGRAADRLPRKWIVMSAMAVISLAALGLAWASARQGDLILTYVCLFVIGVARAFQQPAKASLVPLIVPAERFSNAVTWNTGGFHLASVLGPAFSGLLIAGTGGATLVYILDAFVALGFVAMLAFVRIQPQASAGDSSGIQALAAGISFLWRNQIILGAITLDMFAVLLGGATTLLPVFAEDILGVGPSGLGWLRTAPAVGALSMSVLLAYRPPLERAGRALLWSVAGFGAATILFGLSPYFWGSLALLFLTGALDNISVVIRHTLVQVLTPNELRGRVSAVNGLFISASNELGGFESGFVAYLFGPLISVVSGGVGTILVVIAVAIGWPQLRRYGRLGSGPESA